MAKVVAQKKVGSVQVASAPINEEITVAEVRLIGEDGKPIGIVKTAEALRLAVEAGQDLVLVAEDSVPPVCKILDYGKYRYELQKKKSEAKKKQKTIEVKEVQFRPFIGENDLLVKCRAIKKFIESGDKVKIVLRFRGREINRQELGYDVIKRVLVFCQDFAKEETPAKLEGSVIVTILSEK